MDYYKRIQNAIEFIESNLKEDLEIAEIASKAYFSAFHFQRLFQAISGFSVQEYIRKRRLSEAAVLLRETRKTILEIAVTYQYNSNEAFTRAFEAYFGITPVKYRRVQTTISLQPKVNFLIYQRESMGEISINKPCIVHLNKLNIVGYEYKSNLNNERHFQEIPGFYADYIGNEYSSQIPERTIRGDLFGVLGNCRDNGDFSFIIGEEAMHCFKEKPGGLIGFEIPEGKYAEFKVNGSIELIQNTRRYIYSTWLPNSNYDRKEEPDFETANIDSLPFTNNIELKIYIPLK